MNSDLKYWYLHEHKLFRNLSFSEIDALCILKRFKKSKKNEIIDLPFSEKERIYFLKHGSIKLVKINDHGDELLLDILQKGDLFGDLNLEKNTERNEFFKVVSDEAIICTFFRENLEEVMQKNLILLLIISNSLDLILRKSRTVIRIFYSKMPKRVFYYC